MSPCIITIRGHTIYITVYIYIFFIDYFLLCTLISVSWCLWCTAFPQQYSSRNFSFDVAKDTNLLTIWCFVLESAFTVHELIHNFFHFFLPSPPPLTLLPFHSSLANPAQILRDDGCRAGHAVALYTDINHTLWFKQATCTFIARLYKKLYRDVHLTSLIFWYIRGYAFNPFAVYTSM